MDDSSDVKETRRKPGRPVVHGGAQAAKAIARGEEFTGVPALREAQVTRELAEDGRAELVKRRVIKYQVAADLYSEAGIKLLTEGQYDKAYDYFRLYATLQNSALRGWLQVAADEKNDSDKDAIELIERYRKGAADANDS